MLIDVVWLIKYMTIVATHRNIWSATWNVRFFSGDNEQTVLILAYLHIDMSDNNEEVAILKN